MKGKPKSAHTYEQENEDSKSDIINEILEQYYLKRKLQKALKRLERILLR